MPAISEDEVEAEIQATRQQRRSRQVLTGRATEPDAVRFVLDTNLLVCGVIAAGLPRRLLDGAKAGEFDKRDLLPLGSFQGIDIVTARDAVERLEVAGTT